MIIKLNDIRQSIIDFTGFTVIRFMEYDKKIEVEKEGTIYYFNYNDSAAQQIIDYEFIIKTLKAIESPHISGEQDGRLSVV